MIQEMSFPYLRRSLIGIHDEPWRNSLVFSDMGVLRFVASIGTLLCRFAPSVMSRIIYLKELTYELYISTHASPGRNQSMRYTPHIPFCHLGSVRWSKSRPWPEYWSTLEAPGVLWSVLAMSGSTTVVFRLQAIRFSDFSLLPTVRKTIIISNACCLL